MSRPLSLREADALLGLFSYTAWRNPLGMDVPMPNNGNHHFINPGGCLVWLREDDGVLTLCTEGETLEDDENGTVFLIEEVPLLSDNQAEVSEHLAQGELRFLGSEPSPA